MMDRRGVLTGSVPVVGILILILLSACGARRTSVAPPPEKVSPAGVSEKEVAYLPEADTGERLAAVRALGERGGPDAVDGLIAALKDEDPRVRKAAAEALEGIPDERSINPLIQALADANREVGQAAGRALGAIGEPAAEPLLDSIVFTRPDGSGSPEHLALACRTLGQIGPPAIRPLFDAARERRVQSSDVRAVLGTMGEGAAGTLVELLGDEDPEIRLQAVTALGELKDYGVVDPLVAMLEDKDPRVRARAAGALWRYRLPRVIGALKAAAHDSESTVRARAVFALSWIVDRNAASSFSYRAMPGRMGTWIPGTESRARDKYPDVIEVIAEARSDRSAYVRWEAASGLTAHGDPRSVEAVIGCLYRPPEPVEQYRREAISALGALGDPRGAEAMKRIFEKEQNPDLRGAMAYEVGRIDATASLELLAVAAKDEAQPVRMAAAIVLMEDGGERAMGILKGMVDDESPGIRELARRKVGPAPGAPDVDELLAKLEESDPKVRASAAKALGEADDPRAVDALLRAAGDPYIQVQKEALRALVKVEGGDRTFERAVSLCHEEDSWTRVYAVKALSELKDPRGIEPLAEALKDPDMNVRREAVRALASFDDDRALDPLMTALKDPETSVTQVAVACLAERKDTRAVEPLIELLRSDNAYERMWAADALGKIGSPEAVGPLIDVLRNHEDVWHTRPAAARALGKIGDPRAFDPLAAALEHECSRLRCSAAYGLAGLGDDRAVELMVRRLIGLEEIRVRIELADALAKFGRDTVAGEFLAQFKTSDWFARYSRTPSTRVPGNDLLTGILVASLGDEDATVRLYGVLGLTAVREKGAVDPLIEVLSDEHQDLRNAAANALGELGDPRAGVSLVPLLSDPDYGVRLQTTWALQKIGDESVIEPLIGILREGPDESRQGAMDVLRKTTGVANHNDPRSWIRWWERKQEEVPDGSEQAAAE